MSTKVDTFNCNSIELIQPQATLGLPLNHDNEPTPDLSRINSHVDSLPPRPVSRNTDLPAIDTSLQAWLFVFGATLLEFLVWGYGYAFGVLQEYYTFDPSSPFLGSSTLAVSAIGTIGVGLQYMLGIFFEPLYKTYPSAIKKSMWISLVVASAAFFVSSWATQVWQLIILQGIIFGFSSAALYFPVIVWLSEWFFHRRSTAAGVIFGGSSGGGVIFPFMFRYLLDGLGYRNAIRVWAGFFLVVGAFAIPLIKPRIAVHSTIGLQYPRTLQLPDFSFIKASTFLIFGTTVLAQRLAYTPITILIASYTKTFENVSVLQSTLALVLLNFSGMIGCMITGYTSDRVKYWKVMCVSGLSAALAASLILGFAQNVGTIYGFVVCFGIASGGYASVWTAAAKEIRQESSGTVFLTFGMIGGVATVVGPLIVGVLQRSTDVGTNYGTHGFGHVVIYITVLFVFVATMGLLIGVKERSTGRKLAFGHRQQN